MMNHVLALESSYDGRIPPDQLAAARLRDAADRRKICAHGVELFHALRHMTEHLRLTASRIDASYINVADEALRRCETEPEAQDLTLDSELLAALKLALPYVQKAAHAKPTAAPGVQRQQEADLTLRKLQAIMLKAEAR